MKHKGIVTFFNKPKNYGFITTDGNAEVFFHTSNCLCKITLGLTVEFEFGPPVKLGRPEQAVDVNSVEEVKAVANEF